MNNLKVGITYSEITPESASRGDHSETGWDMETSNDWSLEDLIQAVKNQGYEYMQNNGTSLDVYSGFTISCYKTGTERETCIHIAGTEDLINKIELIIKGT